MSEEGEECWKEIVKYHKNISPILKDERFEGIIYGSLISDWFMSFLFDDENSYLKLLRYWKENNPSKKVLESIKYLINKRFRNKSYYSRFEIEMKFLPEYYIINCYCKFLLNTKYVYTYLEEEEIFEMIDLLIYFGADINFGENRLTVSKIFYRSSRMNSIFKKVEAGRKIVKYINDNLNDELEMKPMRTKIDMRKILESEEKRQKLEE